jgi:hypothetical protein
MAGLVTFVAEDNGKSIRVFLAGPEKNRVNVALVLQFFQVPMALVNGTLMQAHTDGLSMHTFEDGKTY